MPVPIAVIEAAPPLKDSILAVLAAQPTLAFNLQEVIAEVSGSTAHEVALRKLLDTSLPSGRLTEEEAYQSALASLVAAGKVDRVGTLNGTYWHVRTPAPY